MKNKFSLLMEIFVTFFKLGCISFGGGYSMIPLIEREAVEEKKWVDKEKIVDIFAVAESLPGAIALNSSAFVGFSVCGIPGAIAALLGNMTPSVVIILSLSVIFDKIKDNSYVISAFRGIKPAIIGLISYAAYKIGKTAIKDPLCIAIAILSFVCAIILHIEPVKIIISGALLGILLTYIKNITAKTKEEGVSR